MISFELGNIVKTRFGYGEIVEINEEIQLPYLVYLDDNDKGHNGNGFAKKEYSGNHCLWFDESDLKLVKPPTSEINIDSNGIKITCDNLQTTNLIVNRNQELYDWYEKNVKKKEGNNMLESLNLVDLYASKQKAKIESETEEKIEKLKEKNEILNKFKELVQKFKKDCDELYLSQFTEEEKNEILIEKEFDDSDMPLKRDGNYLGSYAINLDFKPSGYYDLINARNIEICKVDDLVKTVKAHVGIAKTKEEVEEILTRYDILNKKGILVIK